MQSGDIFTHSFPFLRDTHTVLDAEGAYEEPTWRPGTRRLPDAPHRDEREADGLGQQVLTVVSVHVLPGRYATRVFYTQRWVDPDGKPFGKGTIRVCTQRKFVALTQGYAYPYSLPGQPSVWAQQQAEYDAALAASYAEASMY